MATSGSTKIQWNGKKYRIDWSIDGTRVEVLTSPDNAELKKAVEQNILEFGSLKVTYEPPETALEREAKDKANWLPFVPFIP
jgi:hypothetical protein